MNESVQGLQRQPYASLLAFLRRAEEHARKLSTAETSVRRDLLQQLVERIEVEPDHLRFTVRPGVLGDPGNPHPEGQSADPASDGDESLILTVHAEIPTRQHGSSITISSGGRPRTRLDPKLIRAVAEGMVWYERMRSGEFPTLRALARSVGRDRPDLGRRIRLVFLAPDIVAAIVSGEQPRTLTIGALLRDQEIPLSWSEQRCLFGFPAPCGANR